MRGFVTLILLSAGLLTGCGGSNSGEATYRTPDGAYEHQIPVEYVEHMRRLDYLEQNQIRALERRSP